VDDAHLRAVWVRLRLWRGRPFARCADRGAIRLAFWARSCDAPNSAADRVGCLRTTLVTQLVSTKGPPHRCSVQPVVLLQPMAPASAQPVAEPSRHPSPSPAPRFHQLLSARRPRLGHRRSLPPHHPKAHRIPGAPRHPLATSRIRRRRLRRSLRLLPTPHRRGPRPHKVRSLPSARRSPVGGSVSAR
jgi:hypothetical protein